MTLSYLQLALQGLALRLPRAGLVVDYVTDRDDLEQDLLAKSSDFLHFPACLCVCLQTG